MRRGPYEVLLVDAVTGEPLPEVDCGVDGLYTVAEPGSAFKIRVSYDDPITTLVEAAVDGNLLDYHYVLRVPGKAVTFQGKGGANCDLALWWCVVCGGRRREIVWG